MKQIPLSRGLFALVDDADFEWLSQFKWYAKPSISRNEQHYVCRRKLANEAGPTTIYMHRALMPGAVTVDHINRNPLDNQRSNLRSATHSQNGCNKYAASKTGLRGVNRIRNKFYAVVYVGGKKIRSSPPRFSQFHAAFDYDRLARKHYGEFATLNFPCTTASRNASREDGV